MSRAPTAPIPFESRAERMRRLLSRRDAASRECFFWWWLPGVAARFAAAHAAYEAERWRYAPPLRPAEIIDITQRKRRAA